MQAIEAGRANAGLEVASWRKAASAAEGAASGHDECMMPPNRTAFSGRSRQRLPIYWSLRLVEWFKADWRAGADRDHRLMRAFPSSRLKGSRPDQSVNGPPSWLRPRASLFP